MQRRLRQECLLAYVGREHRHGRNLAEILEDRYVRRCGSREFVWETLREKSLLDELQRAAPSNQA